MKPAFFLAAFFFFLSATALPVPTYKLYFKGNIIAAKNFFFLTKLTEDVAARKLLSTDITLSALLKTKATKINNAISNCGSNLSCYLEAVKFTELEIASVAERLQALYSEDNALGLLVKSHLKPSGCYLLFENGNTKELLTKAWQQDAKGVNHLVDVYGGGAPPNYPKIDSISFDTRNRDYPVLIHDVLYTTNMSPTQTDLFFNPSLKFALELLEINEREQVADFEPMITGSNRLAVDKIKSTDWRRFPYSIILVPGAGPEEKDVPLSAQGMLRCRLAAIQYRKGMAPFIMVSGGKVHPYKTPYNEAIEMKKFLIDKLNVPADAVIIEPHARHTTTNMRNAARLIYRYGIPFSKPGITCTTRGQSLAIGTTLPDRCLKELNEIPFKNGKRLSETELEFYPLIESLHINPLEPIDP